MSAIARILIVEDDEGLARLQQRRLERANYSVAAVSTAAAGFDRVREGDIDLMVLDQQLPGGVSGLDLFRDIKSAGYQVPAILVTGLGGEAIIVEALRAGVYDFIPKTAEYLDHLLPAVARVLKERQSARNLAESQERLIREQAARAEAEYSREAIRVSEERLQFALGAAHMVAWEWDLATGVTVHSANVGEILDMPELAGRDFTQFIHPDDRERVLAARTTACHGGADYEQEFRLLLPDGRLLWFADKARLREDSTGQPCHLVGACVDVTARKLAEEALKEADRRKDDFLAMLAHELRNPLAPIRNATQVLQLTAPDDERLIWASDVIERQVQHMSRMVDDLLDVARFTRGKIGLQMETLDLACALTRAVEISRPGIDARAHHLSVEFPAEPISLHGDAARLTQVFANLLNNAAKYTREGGHISLSAARVGDDAEVRVRDDGQGIPPPLLERVFDLFTQVDPSIDRSSGGLGIGLTLVKSLVEKHGGRVEVRSEGVPGRGSEFIVRLPALPAAPTEPAPSLRMPGRRSESRRVLVVDDNVDGAQSLAIMLRFKGYEVRAVHDGDAALETAGAWRPDVVFLDIGLPGMDGHEVARRLRRELGLTDATLVAATGYGQEEDRRLSREAGFDFHLVKPVDLEALERLLDDPPLH